MSDEPNDIEWSLEQLEQWENNQPKLNISAAIAGAVRDRDHKIKKGDIKPKKIHVVDRNDPSWTSIKSIPDNEFTKAVLSRADIEFSVNEGEKPLEAMCVNCEKPFIKPIGRGLCQINRCAKCRSPTCSYQGCEVKIHSRAFVKSQIKARGGLAPMCPSHRYEVKKASGRSPPNLKDLAGMDFGYLKAMHRDTKISGESAYWICRCSCGIEKSIRGNNLTRGLTKTCGNRKNHPKIKEDK